MLALTASLVIGLAIGFFILSRAKAISASQGVLANLHSRPSYHGTYVMLWVMIVGLAILLALMLGWNAYLDAKFLGDIRAALPDARNIEIELILSDAKAIAAGLVSSKIDPLREAMAADFAAADTLRIWATVAISLGGHRFVADIRDV